MQMGQPSETAYRAARARARHQVLDEHRVFHDPVVSRLLRPRDAEALARARRSRSPLGRAMRTALAARHRLAEDALAQAVAAGVRQYVILGAGLDTFAYRVPADWADVRIFEVDHPRTQEAKRQLVQRAGLEASPLHRYVPVDFRRDDLWSRLVVAGLEASEPAFFAFLGVSMYLDRPALRTTLDQVARRSAAGSEIVFDYVVAPDLLPWRDQWLLRLVAWRCARLGEPWRTFLDPEEVPNWLRGLGYSMVQPLLPGDLEAKIRAEQNIPAHRKPPRFGMGRMVRAIV